MVTIDIRDLIKRTLRNLSALPFCHVIEDKKIDAAGFCINEKVVTEEFESVDARYRAHYKENDAEIERRTTVVYEALKQSARISLVCLLRTVLKILMKHYFGPLLLEKNIMVNPKVGVMMSELVDAAVSTFFLGAERMAFNLFLKWALKPILIFTNVDEQTADKYSDQIGIIFSTLSSSNAIYQALQSGTDILNAAFQLGSATMATLTGEKMAWALIRALPKVHPEPAIAKAPLPSVRKSSK